MNVAFTALFIAGPALQTWLALLLVRRKLLGPFRFFFTYTAFAVMAEAAKFLVRSDPANYFRAFWITEPIYAVLGYLAIAEVFYRVFKNFYQVVWWFKFLLPGMGLLMVGVSALIAVLRPPIQASEFLATVFVFEIIVKCVQLGVFILIFVLASFYDLFWRQYSFGIAAGFGIAAFGMLMATVIRSVFGTKFLTLLTFMPPVTYLLAVVIWLVSFLMPPPPDPLRDIRPLFTPELMRELIEEYKRRMKNFFDLCWGLSS